MKLRDRLHAPALRLVHNNFARDQIRFELKGSPQTAAAGSRTYTVFPLRDQTDRFWVGLNVDFEMIRTVLRLRAASLVVFEGERETELVPILRAEWDCPSLDDTRKHAQPHWHVYQRQLLQDLTLTSGDRNPDEVQSLDDFREGESLIPDSASADPGPIGEGNVELHETSIGGENVHLAMCASWHQGDDGHSVHFDGKSLSQWLDGCIRYLLVQLRLAA